MTLDEKRHKVFDYCMCTTCKNCELTVGGWSNETRKKCPYIYIGTNNEADIDRALSVICPTKSTEKVSVENDPVNRPSHYTDGKIEVIDFIEDKKLGFCLGNAVKYIARAGKKDPTKEIEDLNKAKWYIERRIKELKEV